jgi:hypothetical protein
MAAVPVFAFGHLGFDEFRAGLEEQIVPEALIQFLEGSTITRNEPLFQQAGADGQILARQSQTVVDRSC